MIGDAVAIEIPEAVSERDAGRAIGACEAALGDDRCGHLDEGFAANFTARVTQSSALELTIELTRAGQDDVSALRVLTFTEEEPEAFRWQSVGVVVAALVLSQAQLEASSLPDSPEPAAAEPGPEKSDLSKIAPTSEPDDAGKSPHTTSATERDVATIDLGPLVASTASEAGVALGAVLGGALRVKGPLHLVASGEASFSAADDATLEVRSRSLGGSLGLALRGRLADPRFEGEVSARGAFQNLRVTATSDTESGSAATGRWGGRAGGAVAWLPTRFVGVVVGGDVGLLGPRIDVDLGGLQPLRISALVWGGYLGLRIRLNQL